MMTLLDVLGKIAWVRLDFLSQGKISDILIRCARIHYLQEDSEDDDQAWQSKGKNDAVSTFQPFLPKVCMI